MQLGVCYIYVHMRHTMLVQCLDMSHMKKYILFGVARAIPVLLLFLTRFFLCRVDENMAGILTPCRRVVARLHIGISHQK